MNKKLIALAVAGVVAVPAIAQADATWYGSVRTSLTTVMDSPVKGEDGKYTGAEEDYWDIKDHSSRFGVKGSNDLGNGLSALYRYEFKVNSDKAQLGDEDRLSYVGIGGDWGAVVLGRQWTPYYNAIGKSDVFNTVGFKLYQGLFRVSNALAYAWNNDDHSFQLAGVVNGDAGDDGDDLDAINAGYSGNFGPVNFGLGYNEFSGSDVSTFGVHLGYNYAENSNVMLRYEDQEDTAQAWAVVWEHGFGANILRLGYEGYNADDSDKDVQDKITDADVNFWQVGLQHNLSDNTRVAVEYQAGDDDNAKYAGDQLSFFVRTDF